MIAIALKLHQSIQFTQSEKEYWNNFTKEEKAYFITGDSQQTLNFTQYQPGYFCGKSFNYFLDRINHPVQNPPTAQIEEEDPDLDLYAEEPPWSSISEESNPALRHNIDTKSDFNPFSEESNSRQNARTSPEKIPDTRTWII